MLVEWEVHYEKRFASERETGGQLVGSFLQLLKTCSFSRLLL